MSDSETRARIMICVAFQRRHIAMFAAVTVAAILVFVGDWLIVTDEEKIDAAMEALRSAVESGNAPALMERVSNDFYNRTGVTRDQLAVMAEDFFSAYGPVEFSRFRFKQNRAGNLAVVVLNVIASLDEGREGTGISTWDLELKKESDGVWRVTDISPVRANGRDVGGWKELPGVRDL